MLPLPLPKLLSFGVPLLLISAAISEAQEFTFDFTSSASDPQLGVFTSTGGVVSDWEDDSGLDNAGSGSVFFELFPGESLTGLTVLAENKINFGSQGLGDGSPYAFDESGDTIKFSFNSPVTIEWIDFKSFGTADEVTLSSDDDSGLFGDSNLSRAGSTSLGWDLAANELFTVEFEEGEFYLEAITVSAVPEPGTVFVGLLGAGVALWGFRKRRRQVSASLD
ncbi:PEP-CTERM sorting domain-containing protein [Pelagicoccus albus]|uniref:PEP-CTERM sorting domain-containing protein n=1 Tax=Pelagicoccus albus TaxID=415222 RepID=A0A7X1E697_9BACT|nr:PEP-CTERM sorting domain-containing protein [Pelagicoccus albus]MBC2604445.1 PEP-CTERM sorting domain-containing protein [Pelagicoccus albus]